MPPYRVVLNGKSYGAEELIRSAKNRKSFPRRAWRIDSVAFDCCLGDWDAAVPEVRHEFWGSAEWMEWGE